MVGSDHDFTWATGYIQMQDYTAIKQLEVVIGSDRIVRVNIDGICALRVRMVANSTLQVSNVASQGGYAHHFATASDAIKP
jgi:hypothetical protein